MTRTLKQRGEAKRLREAERQRAASAASRELAPLPAIENPRRRVAALKSLRLFAETYFPGVFYLEWSADHLHVIEQLEHAIRHGGLQALAMPRASGKTSLVTVAAIWAIFGGLRRFVVIVASESSAAEELLETLHAHVMANPTLSRDFPEICIPLERLGNNNQRRFLWHGKPLAMSAGKTRLEFPSIPGSAAAGAIVDTCGITGNIRGKQAAHGGEVFRPDLALVDDPQTDASAKSETQTADRLKILKGTILGLAGPDVRITCVATVTVIAHGDLSDQILDRKNAPEWRGIRFALMDSWPTADELWEQYFELRRDDLQQDIVGTTATEFYLAHQKAMDAGAKPRWPERYNADEVSAVQHAMNLVQDRGQDVVDAEYQNAPTEAEPSDVELVADEIRVRTSKVDRQKVPAAATRLTAFVDVHGELLYFMALAIDERFGCQIIDYDTHPKQKTRHYTLRNARQTISNAYRHIPTLEGRLYAALQDTFDLILGRSWTRDDADGTDSHVQRLLVDAQWGAQTDTVYSAVRESVHRNLILPSHGRFIGASSEPISRWKARDGESLGDEWRIGPTPRGHRITFDSNHWKTQAGSRLLTPLGSPGACLLYGDDPDAHRLVADHFTAEKAVEVASKHRRVYEWKVKPGRPDNHFLDCFVGCLVAGSTLGANVLASAEKKPQTPRRPIESDDLFE